MSRKLASRPIRHILTSIPIPFSPGLRSNRQMFAKLRAASVRECGTMSTRMLSSGTPGSRMDCSSIVPRARIPREKMYSTSAERGRLNEAVGALCESEEAETHFSTLPSACLGSGSCGCSTRRQYVSFKWVDGTDTMIRTLEDATAAETLTRS